MAESTKCPKCGSTDDGTIIIDGVQGSKNLGEFLLCNDCSHQWRTPEELNDDEFVSVIFPIINGDR